MGYSLVRMEYADPYDPKFGTVDGVIWHRGTYFAYSVVIDLGICSSIQGYPCSFSKKFGSFQNLVKEVRAEAERSGLKAKIETRKALSWDEMVDAVITDINREGVPQDAMRQLLGRMSDCVGQPA